MLRRTLQVILPVVVLGGAAAVTMQLAKNRPAPPQAVAEPVLAPAVAVQALTRQDYPLLIDSQGQVEPAVRTQLVAEVGGRVLEISSAFVTGGLVKQGELLLRIEQGDYRGAVKNAEANLARARAALTEEEARSQVARLEYKQRGIANPPALALREPQLAREKANVQAAIAELERTRRELARTEIRAPYDALVNSRMVELGEFVSRGSQLGEIFGVAQAEIRLPLTYPELQQLALPTLAQKSEPSEVSVTLSRRDAPAGVNWQGEIQRSERIVEAQSRMTYVVASLDDPYNLDSTQSKELAFGSFVKAEIRAGMLNDVVRLPRDAVRTDGKVVLVDTQAGQAELQAMLQSVSVLHSDDEWVYVKDDINDGMQLVTTPLAAVTNGMPLRVLGGAQPELAEAGGDIAIAATDVQAQAQVLAQEQGE